MISVLAAAMPAGRNMPLTRLALSILLLALAGCAQLPYIDEHKSREDVIALFKESTARQRDLAIPDKGTLRYFIGPAEQITDQDRVGWKHLVDLLQSETPLRFIPAKDEESANFVVAISPPPAGEGYSCSEITTTVRSAKQPLEPPSLKQVKVDIHRQNANLLRPCLVRQIMVAIGFEAVDRDDTFSALNRRTALGQPTSTDLYLINMMLKSNLTPEMSDADLDAALNRQYDLVRLSTSNGKNFAELDAAQRVTLVTALQPPPKPAGRKPAERKNPRCANPSAAGGKNCPIAPERTD